jgi:pyruvate dehydrogenase (quinone)
MSTVADQFADTLAAASVKRIYGVVDDSLSGLTDSLPRQVKIGLVHVRRAEVAAFSAGAEADFTGALAVCAGSCGPGNLHFMYERFDCLRSRVPVLPITTHIPSTEIGCDYFQETHLQALFKECSHCCEVLSGSNQMRVLEVAIREAIGKPGVSVRVMPGDLARQAAAEAPPPKVAGLQWPAPVVMPARDEFDGLATLVAMTG